MTTGSITALQYALWVMGPLLQLVIVMVMLYKRLFKELPLFFAYTVFHVLQFIVALVAMRTSYATYFYVYWGTELIDALFGLLVMQEIYTAVFRDLHGLQALGSALFQWVSIVLTALALVSALAAPGTGDDRLIAGLIVLQRSVQILQGGLVIFLFVLCRTFALSWEYYTFGISFGFGVASILTLAASTMRAEFGDSANQAITYILPIATDFSIAIWTYFLVKKPLTAAVEIESVQFSNKLQAWNLLLEESRRA
jgi:hypothetical protein